MFSERRGSVWEVREDGEPLVRDEELLLGLHHERLGRSSAME